MIERDPAFPALKHFFAAYFHQDWECDAADSHEVVADYLTSEHPAPEQLRILVAGIDRLRESYSEAELPAVLSEPLGSYYNVIAPETFNSWLAAIAAQLQRAATDASQ
ncbi:hypothetical protein MANY_36520 [Mycolicibacterium anyangense]|uniref:CdiI immunity protein domain-containing protein n=1 Tax=Mycolicibacterium anyangense TaxID=1431246 RepID=A0A6N4WC09_9MYCO|nr:contact-dependent growth inhibition system immunity protein [Mycolicibacterium anyangense]BBZ78315.1 hypothetical protein MANY_36520 [Mycolicibacterium anyangense]